MGRSVLVIGGGVIGLCVARECARRGLTVTVIERHAAERDGCSFQNAGMVVPSHFVPLAAPGMVALGLKWMRNPASPFYIKPRWSWELLDWGWKFWQAANARRVQHAAPLLRDLSLASHQMFGEFAAESGQDFGLTQRGLLMLCRSQQALDEEAHFARRANDLGVPAEVKSPKALAALDPGITMSVAGGVYFPKDCHLIPDRFLEALERQCATQGVTFRWNCAVTGWRLAGSRIAAVATSEGELEADEIVLCGGSWSPVIAHGLGLKIPIQAGKGYSLTLEQPRELPKLCAIFTEARVAVTPMGGRLRVGGTMEIAGLDESISDVRVRGIVESVPRYYPNFRVEDFAGVRPWRGLRPCSPDGLPYVGRTAKYANLTLATGHAMMGLSLGPITGRVVAETLTDVVPAFDLRLLSPDRYA